MATTAHTPVMPVTQRGGRRYPTEAEFGEAMEALGRGAMDVNLVEHLEMNLSKLLEDPQGGDPPHMKEEDLGRLLVLVDMAEGQAEQLVQWAKDIRQTVWGIYWDQPVKRDA
jgi:hypothetical protein